MECNIVTSQNNVGIKLDMFSHTNFSRFAMILNFDEKFQDMSVASVSLWLAKIEALLKQTIKISS